jgi:glycosyltransferase involved in cell wall biosynthesis
MSRKPRSVIDTYSPEMAKRIEHALASAAYDVVIASEFDTAVYSDLFNSVPAIFEDVELGVLFERFSQASTLRERLRHWLTWFKHRSYLSELLDNFVSCTVVSDEERELVSRSFPGWRNIEVIPNCVTVDDYDGFIEEAEPDTLIFTGPFSYRVNYDAMVWFLREVYPLIQAEVPGVRLTITGDHRNLPLPSTSGVILTGFVNDVRPLVARSWISLAPLREGGGTRLKILEAMALRSAVVTTSKGAEGLAVESGKHLFLADEPEAFADAVIRLLGDRNMRERITSDAYGLVRRRYDWKRTLPHFMDLVERTAQMQGGPVDKNGQRIL